MTGSLYNHLPEQRKIIGDSQSNSSEIMRKRKSLPRSALHRVFYVVALKNSMTQLVSQRSRAHFF